MEGRSLVLSVLLSSTVVSFLQSLVIVLFSFIVLGASIPSLFVVLVILLVSVLFNQLLGTVLLFLVGTSKAANVVTTIYGSVVPMLVGLYFPLPDSALFRVIRLYGTPMSLANTASIRAMEGDYGSMALVMLLLWLLLSLLVDLLREESDTVRREADELRLKVHCLQEEEQHLLLDYQDAQQLSRLEERNHIARILHDSLGHELTAAHLTLKALGSLLQRNEVEKALDSQAKALVRLENSLDQLKLAVRQLQRDDDTANQRFRQLFEQFNYPVDLHQSGDIEVLDPAVQQVLYSAVKEALTNIAKHAKPAMVRAQLAITGTTTRLMLENDGLFDQKNEETGNGLRYMRRRVEALGGSVAIQRDETFRLLITLPSKKEMG